MENNKSVIVKSILRFLRNEIENSKFDVEQKESLEVAKQCLESTYDIDGNDGSITGEGADLYILLNVDKEVTEETLKLADELKTRGNTHMKMGEYTEAVEFYTKAIDLNPKNHVFYCNRAAAYSRLEKHWDAIADCKESIKINPTAKAYGRLGVAYSNMSMYQEAKEAYHKAHTLDPVNSTYEQNLKLAEELLRSQSSDGLPTASSLPGASPINFNNFINNPALLNMASQMISDPAFLNMVSNMMSSEPSGDPNLDGFISVTQQLAQQMQAVNPNLIETLRQTMNVQNSTPSSSDDSKEEEPQSKQ